MMRSISLFSTLLCISFLTVNLSAQNVSETKQLRPTKVEQSKKFNSMNRDYLYETAKILKFFKSGSIPVDFPKATNFSSAESYKSVVLSYIESNYDLFNHDELAKHNVFVKQKTENNITEQEYRKQRFDAIDRTAVEKK